MWLFLNFDSQVQNGFFLKIVISKNFPQRNEKLVKFMIAKWKFPKRKKCQKKKETKLFKKKHWSSDYYCLLLRCKNIISKEHRKSSALFEQDSVVRMRLKFWPSHSHARLSSLFFIQVQVGVSAKRQLQSNSPSHGFTCSGFCMSGQTHSKPPTVTEQSWIPEKGFGEGWGGFM